MKYETDIREYARLQPGREKAVRFAGGNVEALVELTGDKAGDRHYVDALLAVDLVNNDGEVTTVVPGQWVVKTETGYLVYDDHVFRGIYVPAPEQKEVKATLTFHLSPHADLAALKKRLEEQFPGAARLDITTKEI